MSRCKLLALAAVLASCTPALLAHPDTEVTHMTHDEAVARIAIRELIDRYHAAVNRRDWTLFSQLFAPDAVWEALAPINLRFEGHEQIMTGLKASVLRQELLVQASSGLVIDVAGGTATVQSTLIEIGRENGTGAGWYAVAFYEDSVVKRGNAWRFARRTLRVRFLGNTALAGNGFEVAP